MSKFNGYFLIVGKTCILDFQSKDLNIKEMQILVANFTAVERVKSPVEVR